MKDVNIYICTEYSGSLKSGTGMCHVILETMVKTKKGDEPATLKEIKTFEDITKNRLELLAIDMALSHLSKRSRITIYTASDYITGAFMQGWPDKWASNDFKKKNMPIKHADLWKSIMEQIKSHDVTVIKADSTTYMKAQAVELRNFKEKSNKSR
jgi:ribonuclease HI